MKKLTAFLASSFLLLLLTPAHAQNYKSIRYDMYLGGKLAGYQISQQSEDGFYFYEFEYNDRGRGPHIEERIKLNEKGVIQELKISGNNYLKDKISESFSIRDQVASWSSTTEEGSVETDGDAFFVSINGTMGSLELLVRKMLSNPDSTLSLLPSGVVKITGNRQLTLGDSLRLSLFEISGFSFTPQYVWFDEDNRLFASVSSWSNIMPEGYNELAGDLLEVQQEMQGKYYKKIAASLTTTPDKPVVIKNVSLFNSGTAKLVSGKTVIINGNTIEQVLEDAAEIPNDALVIDGTGKTLLPGLFDNHTHVGRSDGLLHLAAGVTSIRDMANSPELPEIKKDFDNGAVIGPRIVLMAGFIDQAGPYAGPGLTITNLEEGFTAIENYKKKGYQQIKLYSSIEPEWVEPLAAKAHELGMKLSGHIPAGMLAEEAIADGYDEIQHINMLILNFLSDTIDTRTPLRFSAPAENALNLDLQSPEFQNFIRVLKENEIIVDPTVSIFEGMFTTKQGEADPMLEEVVERLPIQVQRGQYSGGLPIPAGMEETYKASYQKMLDIVSELYENEITIVPGTDAMAGFALHNELEMYERAGIPAAEVLKLVTLTSAEVSSVDDQLGSIEQGKLADLILVDGNPVENIKDIRRVVLTIKDGKIYYPEDLYEAVGVSFFN